MRGFESISGAVPLPRGSLSLSLTLFFLPSRSVPLPGLSFLVFLHGSGFFSVTRLYFAAAAQSERRFPRRTNAVVAEIYAVREAARGSLGRKR